MRGEHFTVHDGEDLWYAYVVDKHTFTLMQFTMQRSAEEARRYAARYRETFPAAQYHVAVADATMEI